MVFNQGNKSYPQHAIISNDVLAMVKQFCQAAEAIPPSTGYGARPCEILAYMDRDFMAKLMVLLKNAVKDNEKLLILLPKIASALDLLFHKNLSTTSSAVLFQRCGFPLPSVIASKDTNIVSLELLDDKNQKPAITYAPLETDIAYTNHYPGPKFVLDEKEAHSYSCS